MMKPSLGQRYRGVPGDIEIDIKEKEGL